jgi:hypothetical protein
MSRIRNNPIPETTILNESDKTIDSFIARASHVVDGTDVFPWERISLTQAERSCHIDYWKSILGYPDEYVNSLVKEDQ